MENYYGIIELFLVFCLAIGLLGFELYRTRKTIADDARRASMSQERQPAVGSDPNEAP